MIEVTKKEILQALKEMDEADILDNLMFGVEAIRRKLLPKYVLCSLLNALEREGKVIKHYETYRYRKNRAKIRS